MGDTPQRWAQAASEWRRSGLSPAAITSAAAVSGPTPKRSRSSGTVATSSASIRSSSSANSSSRELIRFASEESDALVSAERVGRTGRPKLDPFGHQSRDTQTLQSASQLVRGRVAQVAHLDQSFDSSLTGRALGHDQDADRFDGTVSGLRTAGGPTAEGSSSGFDGVEGIGLATAASLVTVGTIHLDHGDARSAQVAGQPGTIGASPLHADLGDVAKRVQPLEQRLVAGRVNAEGLRTQQARSEERRVGKEG